MKSRAEIDLRVFKALAHPLRARILDVLDHRTASPSEIATELDAPLGNVAYHVRQLAEMELIRLVKSMPRRGAIEHYYRADARLAHPEAHLKRTRLMLDQQGIKAVARELRATVERVERIQTASGERLARSGGSGEQHAMLAMVFF